MYPHLWGRCKQVSKYWRRGLLRLFRSLTLPPKERMRTLDCYPKSVCRAAMLPLIACCAMTAFGQEFTITSSNVTYSGLNISNPNGICINIRPYVSNVKIVNSNIGPCGDAGVHISAFTSGISVQNNTIHD